LSVEILVLPSDKDRFAGAFQIDGKALVYLIISIMVSIRLRQLGMETSFQSPRSPNSLLPWQISFQSSCSLSSSMCCSPSCGKAEIWPRWLTASEVWS